VDSTFLKTEINDTIIYAVPAYLFHNIYLDKNNIPDGFVIFNQNNIEYIGVDKNVVEGMGKLQRVSRKIPLKS
jgi:hypothetical protein